MYEYYSEEQLRGHMNHLLEEMRPLNERLANIRREDEPELFAILAKRLDNLSVRLLALIEGGESPRPYERKRDAVLRLTSGLKLGVDELKLRQDLLDVAGAALMVPSGQFGENHFADFSLCRYFAYTLQGHNLGYTDSWRPQGKDEEMVSNNIAPGGTGVSNQGPFHALWARPYADAIRFGEATLPALKRIVQWSQARLPSVDLPFVDLPGVDENALNTSIRRDSLDELEYAVVVFATSGAIKWRVLDDLAWPIFHSFKNGK